MPRGAGVFTAQIFDNQAFYLADEGARAARRSFRQVANSLSGSMIRSAATRQERHSHPKIFNLYDAWSGLTGHCPAVAARRAIARGEQVFNTKKINITGVAGTE